LVFVEVRFDFFDEVVYDFEDNWIDVVVVGNLEVDVAVFLWDY